MTSSQNAMSGPQGLDLKIKGNRVVTFSTPRGFMGHAQLQLLSGIKGIFTVMKELKGLHLQVCFGIFPFTL